ncbi:hypothetical protein niasHT_013361 [Heterodera trifolii]|uniref:Uncharacterized protein n=1 Tax=Heterodera trifolii TaxID=157864 RepID=A0ABD2L873_9BILA
MENIPPPKSAQIHALSAQLSRRICTGQVIVSLAGACRELIDNAIDADATNIEIRVTDNGLECLEVVDNGSGIHSSNFEHLCKAHSTSKLSVLDDFHSLTTFGFRGEALNALAALGDVQITTRDVHSRCATRLTFGRNGEQLATEQCSRPQGTTVRVAHLFKPLPVRRAEFQRQARREFLRLVECVQAFAIARPWCRFTCTNSANGGKRSTVLCTPGGSSTRLPQVLDSLFGTGGAGTASSAANGKSNGGGAQLLLLDETVGVPSDECLQLYGVPTTTMEQREKTFTEIRLSGYVSSCLAGHGRSSADRQFVFVNQRHVDFPKLCRIANEVYAQFNRGRFCCLVLFVDVPPHTLDVNISPDKRTVFLHHEKEVFAKLRVTLFATFAKCQGHCSIAMPSSSAAAGDNNGWSPEAKKRRTIIGTLLRRGDILEANGGDKSVERNDQTATNDDDGTDQTHFNRHIGFSVETQQSVDLSCMTFGNAGLEMDEAEQTMMNNEDEQNCSDQTIVQRKTQTQDEYVVSDDWPNANKVGTKMARKSETTTRRTSVKLTAGQKALEAFSFQRLRSAGPSSTIIETSAVDHLHIEPQQRQQQQRTFADQQIPNEHNFGLANQIILPKNEPPNSQNSQQYYDSAAYDCCPSTAAEDEAVAAVGFEFVGSSISAASAAEEWGCNAPPISSQQPISQCFSVVTNSSVATTSCSQMTQQFIYDEEHDEFGDDIDDDDDEEATAMSSSFSFRPQQIVHVDMDMLRTNFAHRCEQQRRQRREHNNLLRRQHDGDGEDEGGTRLHVVTTVGTMLSTGSQEEGMEEDKASVEQRLSMMLNKADFARMRLIGQFNNAFLIVRLRSDVFIIDQHAADEKYNFERLLAHNVIKSQALIRPKRLRLGNVNAALMRDNLHVFHANGFDFQFYNGATSESAKLCWENGTAAAGNKDDDAIVIEDIDENDVEPILLNDDYDNIVDEQQGGEDELDKLGTVLLTAVPVLHGWQLDRDDIDQLLSMLSELPGIVHRPSKVRKIFASKACRHSVMFGKALTQREMETIIFNMGSMDQPWNCPHGRPTIRHFCTVERIMS